MPKRKSSLSLERKVKFKKEDKDSSINKGKKLSKASEKDKEASSKKKAIKLKGINYENRSQSSGESLNTIKSPVKEPLKEAIESELIGHWENDVYIARAQNISISTAKNIIQLFDEANTIPFIARYRRNLVGDLEPSRLREIKDAYESIKKVHAKAEKIILQLAKNGDLTIPVFNLIKAAQTFEELDFIASPLKKNCKQTLAFRAKEANLEEVAMQILEGAGTVYLESYIQPNNEQLKNIKNIKSGIQNIIADIISKNVEIQSIASKIVESGSAKLEVEEAKSSGENNLKKNKYDMYKGFSQTVKYIKAYQILAINRGEVEGELSSKIKIGADQWVQLKSFCQKKWLGNGRNYELRQIIITDSINDAIKRLLSPYIKRRIRAKLNKDAEKEALNIFGANLKQLLLTPPCKGKTIMGIDPGFRHGCKVAVISLQGIPLKWEKFFLPRNNADKKNIQECELILKELIVTFECETIALGNGTGCRETEALLGELIKKNLFEPLNVSYTIISEQGVSIYSCSQEAAEEFPNLDVMYIGAVSLARRLQDPLSELVKVEPKHLGVGLYQHDLKKNQLNYTLNEIVSECVSFVGVDVNTSSFYLLRRVAGLDSAKAREIMNYRKKNTSFKSLEELKKVKGIKEKTFLQCAGFLRITALSAGLHINPLDQTAIHPESYATAKMLANKLKIDLNKIGTEEFINRAKAEFNNFNVATWAKEFGVSNTDVSFIMENFTNPTNYDIRKNFSGPIFRKEITKLSELKVGLDLTGVVKNVVPFGAFVDVGVGLDGLIHSSKMDGEILNLNDKVLTNICSINLSEKRIALRLVRKI